jgi:hypothetical protein
MTFSAKLQWSNLDWQVSATNKSLQTFTLFVFPSKALPKNRAFTFFGISSKDYKVISFPPMRTQFSHYEVGGYMQR